MMREYKLPKGEKFKEYVFFEIESSLENRDMGFMIKSYEA